MSSKKKPQNCTYNENISNKTLQDKEDIQADDFVFREQDLLELMLYPDSPRVSDR